MRARLPALLGVLIVVVLVAVAVTWAMRPQLKSASAIFTQTVQLYPDDEVRLLGVKIGRITAVSQVPGGVRVDLEYDADAPIPDDARAGIIAPALLNRRYVQFAPARVPGPRLPDGAVLGPERTAVPVEYDEVKKQLDQLASLLGPQNPQVNGALGRAIDAGAANLRGNGANLKGSIENLSRALGTLSDGREDLFGTVRNLRVLISALRTADDDVAGFTRELAQTSRTLDGSGDDLAKALDTLDSSVKRIGEFTAEHRDRLTGDLKDLARLADNLADNRQALANLLQVAPTALNDFQNIYDAYSNSIGGALSATNFEQTTALNQLLGLFLNQIPGADLVQRNGSANFVTEKDGLCKRPDPDPKLQPIFDPRITPPPPYGGEGTQAYFADKNRCHGPIAPDLLKQYSPEARSLANLLIPGSGGDR
jgi:phospholipid/cholesterol/gamma-HCH transport system substrate-binding protein